MATNYFADWPGDFDRDLGQMLLCKGEGACFFFTERVGGRSSGDAMVAAARMKVKVFSGGFYPGNLSAACSTSNNLLGDLRQEYPLVISSASYQGFSYVSP
jgi:hypothetical protein